MGGVALFNLTGEYLALMNTLSDGDFDAQTIADTIEGSGLTEAIAEKACGVEMVARTIEMHVPAIDAEIERLAKLKKQRQTAAAALRDYLKRNLIAAGISKLESPLFKIALRDNPPAVDIFDASLLPSEFMTQPAPPPPAPDKAAIKAAIKAGEEVPGARLTQGQRLEVK
jgi:hypothetical protein